MEENKQHIQLPNELTKIAFVKPQDLLVYLAIKKYANGEGVAFPSLRTIANLLKINERTVTKSIKALEKSKYLKVTKKGKNNYYTFTPYANFECFSYDFLEKEDLTFNEKAYYAITQQYMFKDQVTQSGKVSFSDQELDERIHLPRSTRKDIESSLREKGYMQIIKTNSKDELGFAKKERIYNLEQFGQQLLFILKNHDDILVEHDSEINSLKKDNQILKDNITNLQDTVSNLENTIKYFQALCRKNGLETDEKDIKNYKELHI